MWFGFEFSGKLSDKRSTIPSGLTDGGAGVSTAPLGKLNVKNGPLLEVSWTAEYESASTKFRKSVGLDILNTEILQCLANQQPSNDHMNRNFNIVAASGAFQGRGARNLPRAPLFRGSLSRCFALKCSSFLVKSLSSALIIFFKAHHN